MKKFFSFAAGFLAVILLIVAAVITPAMNPARFEKAVLNTVNREAVGMSESDLTAFARETMDFLRGKKDSWEPRTPFPVPQSFADHMAEVRGWIKAFPAAAIGVQALVMAVLFLRPQERWLGAGLASAFGLIAAVILWAVIDFDSLWMVIHRVLIPNGIFPANEPVMQLFPLSLFFSYIRSVVCWLGAYMAGVLGLGWLIRAISRRRRRSTSRS